MQPQKFKHLIPFFLLISNMVWADQESISTEAPPPDSQLSSPLNSPLNLKEKESDQVTVEQNMIRQPAALKSKKGLAKQDFERTQLTFEAASVLSLSRVFISFQGEYQPKFIQKYGVLGVGASFSVADTIQTVSNLGFGVGGLIRYQFKYIPYQFAVPMIGYQFEYRSYDSNTGLAGLNIAHSAFGGVWFLINAIDYDAFVNLNSSFGIKETYAVVEIRNNFSQSNELQIRYYDFYLGIRLEY